MTTRNLCLGCFDDFAENNSALRLCLACEMKHDEALVTSAKSFSARNNKPEKWWGPKWWPGDPDTNIAGEDLQHGFTAIDADGTPIEFFFSPQED